MMMEMDPLYLSLVTIGGLVLLIGLVSGYLKKRTFLTGPMVALVVGIVLGPAVLDWLDPADWGNQEKILREVAQITLAIGLMSVALRLPSEFVPGHWKSLAVFIFGLMPMMWLSASLIVYIGLGVSILLALLVGAVIVPTDPVVSTSIVTGEVAAENLPERIRHTLSAESGLNDGLAYPIFAFSMILFVEGWNGMGAWGYYHVGWKVGGAVLFGLILGHGAGWLLHWSEAKGTIEQTSFLAYTLALSLLSLGAAKLLGMEGLLAVFITGLSFDRVVRGRERAEEAGVQEAVNQFFTLPVFSLFGLMAPWDRWGQLGWAGWAIVAAVLLLRRLPFLILLKRFVPELRVYMDAAYLGWFGPIGVAALYYSILAKERTGQEEPWVVGSFVVFASILFHGVTATPLTKWYGKRARQRRGGSE
jgi:sodium/hydrogen antiporter